MRHDGSMFICRPVRNPTCRGSRTLDQMTHRARPRVGTVFNRRHIIKKRPSMTTLFARRQQVLVMHPDPIIAAGLESALRTEPQFTVACSAGDFGSQEFESTIDVIVSDFETGMQMTHLGLARIGRRQTSTVVVTSGRPREYEIQEALSRGVLGFIAAGCQVDELINAVQAAASGTRFLCHAAAQEIADSMTKEALTRRERDVLQLLSSGCCNKAIATRLDVAVGTVKAHVRAIMSKLGASSRTEAASIASKRGIIRPGAKSPNGAKLH
jgi:DNA-binding NarL/FixJ family response regulator